MKQWQSASVIAAVTLAVAFNLCPPLTLRAQPQLTDAQLLALQPTPPSLIPSSGTFWSVSRPNYPPLPWDPYPGLPVYRLPDGSYLVDDSTVLFPPSGQTISAPAAARTFLTQATLASQQRLASMLNDADAPGIPGATNSPPPDPSPPQLLAPGTAPTYGTFWMLVETNWPPFFYDPCAGCDVYALSDGSYLVDDTSFAWPQPSGGGVTPQGGSQPSYSSGDLYLEITGVTNSLANLILHGTTSGVLYTVMSRQSFSPNDPWDAEQQLIGADGQDWTSIQIPTFGRRVLFFRALVGSATPQRLWLYALGISQNSFNLVLHGTTDSTSYDLLSTPTLQASNNWAVETNFLGTSGQFWTPVTIPLSGRPSLFLSARSWADSTGSGIPDWWLLQYFGTTDVNPNALDSAGDGWTIYQKFQMGLNPNVFYTPPAPQGLTVTYNANNGTAIISWLPSPGPVTGYTLTNSAGQSYNLPASATSFTNNVSGAPNGYYMGDPTLYETYQLQAHYAGGNSALANNGLLPGTLIAAIIYGPQGSAYLEVSAMPVGTTAIQLSEYDEFEDFFEGVSVTVTNIDIAVTTNGLYLLPAIVTPPDNFGEQDYPWWGQAFGPNGALSVATFLGWSGFSSSLTFTPATLFTLPATLGLPYFDGRVQLKQNLIFLLRAGLQDSPFRCQDLVSGSTPPTPNSANYVYADLYEAGGSVETLSPFGDNYLYRNFAYGLSDTDTNGAITTGVSGGFSPSGDWILYLQNPATYQFDPPTSASGTIPAVLATNDTKWLCSYDLPDSSYLGEIGITNYVASNPWEVVNTMFSNARNIYGLPFLSAKIAWGNSSGSTTTLYAGYTTTNLGYFYPETAQPQFQTVEYDFWNPSVDTLPGGNGFSTTNQSSLIITTVGPSTWQVNGALRASSSGFFSQFQVAGYAKLAITNGYANTFAYLGQYFDQAYRIGTNGTATTNTTGVLSEYGHFAPTEPGPVALRTMPDLDTGQRGTCTVYCVSLALDANHDGTMDTSFNGPDTTSISNSYTFWCNNNFDRWNHDSWFNTLEQDDQQTADCPFMAWTATPDCNYTNIDGFRVIPCTRDLEDYARLWLCGMTSNLMAALPLGASVTLSWGDVANPNSANPTIDLFQAADPDGGIGYLTNETIAVQQTNTALCPYVGRLAPGGNLELNTLLNYLPATHFIWCGVSNGSGGLTLTISDANGNTLAQTTAYIQIVDIKQMYERWTVGDDPNVAPTNTAYLATEGLPAGAPKFQYTPPTDPSTAYILHVHGFNMAPWEKDRYAETAFKRLYWQGYQGRFGEFRWPTTLQGVLHPNPWAFDNSEIQAWNSAAGLLDLLTSLNAEYPGHVYLTAHSHGNVVAGEALRLAGANKVVNTYVAMQGAVDSHTYDPTTAVRPVTFSTPDRYGQYYTDGAPCYFNGSAGAGTFVNFFNTNDWALATTIWQRDQNSKPDSSYDYSSESDTWSQQYVPLVFPHDTYTIFSFCDQAHAYALGAQPNVSGAFTGNQVNLPNVWPPDPLNNAYRDHIWHSAEFRSDNPQRWQFWNAVLTQMKLK